MHSSYGNIRCVFLDQTPNLPDTDVDGDPRILDGDSNGTAIVDMGVDEFLALPSEEITLIESRLKKAATLIYVSSQNRVRHRRQEHERQYQFLFRRIGAPIFRFNCLEF